MNRFGQFEISSVQINKVRQSRLMAKFDQRGSLPTVFRENGLSILPLSRNRYVIGFFETHETLVYDLKADPVYMPLPPDLNLQSLDPANLYSETAAINCAHLAGIIDDVVGEQTYLSVNGRMTTGTFDMRVKNSPKGNAPYTLIVDRAQCEVDGGFEGPGHFVLLEAKNLTMPNFLVRQLYYPYRLWSGRLTKSIIPVLMTYSNDIFDFFVYDFEELADYNSLRLVQHKRYTVIPQDITRDDIEALLGTVQFVPEAVTFPQANDFSRVVDLLTILARRVWLTRDLVTAEYGFTPRQTNYYTDAARYLGLLEKSKDPVTRETHYTLTTDGRKLFEQRPRDRYLGLIRRILQHEVFFRSFMLSLQQGDIPDQESIASIMAQCNILLNKTTSERRAQTVQRWMEWIWGRIVD